MQAPPRAIVVISDGAQDGGRIEPDEAVAAGEEARRARVLGARRDRDGRRRGEGDRGLPQDHQGAGEPGDARSRSRQASGGEFFAAPDAEGLQKVYEELGSRLGTRKQDREITDLFAALAAGLLLVGGVTSAFFLKGVP